MIYINICFSVLTVPLYGKCDIDWNDECSDRNAECRDNICKCSYGYHAKYGICSMYRLSLEFYVSYLPVSVYTVKIRILLIIFRFHCLKHLSISTRILILEEKYFYQGIEMFHVPVPVSVCGISEFLLKNVWLLFMVWLLLHPWYFHPLYDFQDLIAPILNLSV